MVQKTANEILAFSDRNADVRVLPGETVVITGPNGVGKSSFIQEISPPGAHERFFGSRQIYFHSEETTALSETLNNVLQNISYSTTRFRTPYGEQHLKSVIRRVVDRQYEANNNIIQAQNDGASFEDAKLDNPLPTDQINGIFEMARLAVRVHPSGQSLQASRGGSKFGIDRLSDGERAALLLVAAIIIQKPNSVLLLDEPERHLNPSISGPLVSAAIRLRADISYVFSTHDLPLIDWLRPEKIIHISDSTITSHESDTRSYTYSILGAGDGIPEELRHAILGSRRALLLVEGTATSEDKALYSLAFPGWNVVGREGWGAVTSGVTSLVDNETYHWLKVAGIVDGDGRDEREREILTEKGIFALPLPTIENVFALAGVVSQMAQADFDRSGGSPVSERLETIEQQVRQVLTASRNDIIARRVMWAANRALEGRKVSIDDVRRGAANIDGVNIQSISLLMNEEFEIAMAKSSVFEAMKVLPIKNSRVPATIAKIIGYETSRKYYRAVLHQIEVGTDRGRSILDTIKENLPSLPST